jgi:Mn2+/Fe2+ NRAMP family transporter
VSKNTAYLSYKPIIPQGTELIFLIAFMGWMPAPLDISIWHSLWTIEKNKKLKKIKINIGLQDFNVGYFTTIFLGICFMGLGALVMFNSNTEFSESGSIFADQLINLYTSNLGENFYIFIAIAALTTMFSTSLTTLDASPRAMEKASELLFPRLKKLNYLFWISCLSIGTCLIFLFLLSEMGKLVQIATVLSFITAPFYAILNYVLVTSKQMPEKYKPKKFIKILSLMGIIFLSTFSIGYLIIVLKL